MIDCHAHAFPSIGESLNRLSPRAAGAARDLGARAKVGLGALPFASAIAARLSSALDATVMDVERVASLRQTSEMAKRFEPLLALASLPQLARGASVAKLYESMERNGIEKTVLIAAEPLASNEWLLEQARQSDGKLVPVVNVPAMASEATDAQWYDAFVELAEGGARGFKIHLNMDGLGADHRGYRFLFEVAQREGLFVIIHTGCFHAPGYKRTESADPSLFTPLFEEFRDVRVCLAHMSRDAPEKAWEAMKRFDQLWADTSWQPRDAVKRAVREVGAGRVLLGSDWPLLHGELQGDVLRILRDAVGDSVAETIGTSSARAFLEG